MRKLDGSLQKPVAYLTCNFNRPVNGKPALFTHDEVITLFHEFGHGLHHMLTRIDTAGVSGISGVPWDAVELPSQFMENWCWEPEALAFISGHYETGEPLPQELLENVLAADAFSRFEEEGIFNRETGQSFLDNILSRGGSEEPMELFKRFRGREPQLDAMLEHYGIKG